MSCKETPDSVKILVFNFHNQTLIFCSEPRWPDVREASFFSRSKGQEEWNFSSHLHYIQRVRPRFIILNVGSNDLSSSGGLRPETLGSTIHEFVNDLNQNYGVEKVIVLQQLRREHAPYLNSRIDLLNRYLRVTLEDEGCTEFWRHPHLSMNTPGFYLDGTHLGPLGMERYYRSIRGVIIQYCNVTN